MKYVATILFIALMLPACEHPPTDNSVDDEDNLQLSVRTFHRDMRWMQWESAARLVAPEERQQFLGRYEELGEDFHIVELDLKSVSNVSGDEALVDIEQRSYVEPNMTVKKQRFIEVWKKRDDGWLMTKRMLKDEYKEMKKAEQDQKPKADKTSPNQADASNSSTP